MVGGSWEWGVPSRGGGNKTPVFRQDHAEKPPHCPAQPDRPAQPSAPLGRLRTPRSSRPATVKPVTPRLLDDAPGELPPRDRGTGAESSMGADSGGALGRGRRYGPRSRKAQAGGGRGVPIWGARAGFSRARAHNDAQPTQPARPRSGSHPRSVSQQRSLLPPRCALDCGLAGGLAAGPFASDPAWPQLPPSCQPTCAPPSPPQV
jgi:hypothetical protein